MTQEETWYSHEERKLLLKERYSSGSSHYFFELKEAKNGAKYLIISQRKKVGDKFVGEKIRIFEDEILGFNRVFQSFIKSMESSTAHESINQEKSQDSNMNLDYDSELSPVFFSTLLKTNNWKDFERYTYHLLKLLGVSTIYNFLDERQAGKADGFFKIGNLAVIYDCTLNRNNIENDKGEQLNNYYNCLNQGRINIAEGTTEEFYNYRKQVWIITRGKTQLIKLVNSIEIKEVAVQDIMQIYQDRLRKNLSNKSLEIKLDNL